MMTRLLLFHQAQDTTGVPTTEYDSLRIALAPILGDYLTTLQRVEGEFNHTEFKRIPYPQRLGFGERIARTLVQHGAFLSGFYRPGESFVMEHVREAVMDTHEGLPEDVAGLYSAAVEELRQMYYPKGEKSQLLAAFMTLPISACAHMLEAFDCPFRFIYDPRERREDLSVKERIEGLSEVMARMSPQIRGLFKGFEIGTSSEKEPGLQIADLVAGETREFLVAFPEIMSQGATRRIISQSSQEEFEAFDVMRIEGNAPFAYKVGNDKDDD